MVEIKQLPLKNANNAAHFSFLSSVVKKAESDAAVSDKCAAQVAALREAVQKEDENLQTSSKSMLTDKIAAADALRDKVYMCYKKIVLAYADYPDDTFADAAGRLSQHIKDYKIDTQSQLDKETGLLVNFIQDLEGKLKADVETLGLSHLVPRLKEENEKVIAYMSDRTDERSAKTAGALKAARLAADEAYKMLCDNIKAHSIIEGDEAYKGFASYVNAEIDRFKKEVIAKRK